MPATIEPRVFSSPFLLSKNINDKIHRMYSSCGTWWHTRRNQISFFPRNGRVHLNRWGRQFSRLLAAEVCASAWVMLDTPRSEVAWEYWLPTPFASFPFTSPPVRHRVPPGSERAVISPVNKMVFISQTHLLLLYLMYYSGKMFRLAVESSSGPYTKIQILNLL